MLFVKKNKCRKEAIVIHVKSWLQWMKNRKCVFSERFDNDTIFDLKKMHKTCLNKYETKKILNLKNV